MQNLNPFLLLTIDIVQVCYDLAHSMNSKAVTSIYVRPCLCKMLFQDAAVSLVNVEMCMQLLSVLTVWCEYM